MKTATVTWATDHNYGTLLQAYALQKKIMQLGHDNVILSDAPVIREVSRNYRPIQTAAPVQTANRQPMLKRLVGLVCHPQRLARVIAAHTDSARYARPYNDVQEKCAAFLRNDLSVMELSEIPAEGSLDDGFDSFICGSDQIWSVLSRRFHPYYFLQFTGKKKIAYAPSLGTANIPEDKLAKMQEYLRPFHTLSVREQKSAQQLSALMGREAAWVADPTLLHGAAFWRDFASDAAVPGKKKYLLCYFLEDRPWYFAYAKKIAKENHLKILLLPNKWDFLSRESLLCSPGIGPREFVGLFANADYVLTDSYHGSIFSVIFEKEFLYLLRFAQNDPRSQNIRIQSLFDRLELNDRIVEENTSGQSKTRINYPRINEKLEVFKRESERFLKDSLEN